MVRLKKPSVPLIVALVIVTGCSTVCSAAATEVGEQAAGRTKAYRSPTCLAISPEGETLYTTDQTAGSLVILELAGMSRRGEISLRGAPQGVAVSLAGNRLYVAEHGAGSVAVIDTSKGEVAARIAVGKWPAAVAVADKTDRVYVCNQDNHSVSVIDLSQGFGQIPQQISVVREPSCLAVTPDERYLVVTNGLPRGVGTDPTLAAEVSIIDTDALSVVDTVKLPPGSTLVNGVCVSPHGKWAYVVHGIGRFNLPITQLERGWVNTHALTIINIAAGKRLATMLLDDLTRGAADPHSVVCSQDGMRLWISHAGVHEISSVDIGLVHELLAGRVPADLAALEDGTLPNIWVRIQQDQRAIAELEHDLTALYIADAIQRVPSGGIGPRGIALSPDETKLLVANYYSGAVAILSAQNGELEGTISLGQQPEPDATRRGEIIFHDARHAFQRWHSCASCHPNQGRVDALRWDFLRDGIGNGKDTPSLVLVAKTEPFNRRATRKDVRECARTGLMSGHMIVPTDAVVDDLLAYLNSLRPEPSPYRAADGGLTAAAERGKGLFHGKAHCAGCHPPPYFTDKKMHNVGALSHNEPDGLYDTPTLLEAHRTAPYLHDGRAMTLEQVFVVHDEQGRHGNTKTLTAAELNDLLAYLRSL